MASPHGQQHDDVDDDAAIEAAAATDAFGLGSLASGNDAKESEGAATTSRKIAALPARSAVANPDVLTEVCILRYCQKLCRMLTLQITKDLSRPSTSLITRPTDTLMNINLTYEDMTRPVEGPENVLGHLRGSGSAGPGLGSMSNY